MLIPDTAQTIAAPASAPGHGAIAVVRLSGPLAHTIPSAFLKPLPAAGKLRAGTSYLLRAEENGRLLDRTVVIFHRGPKSYTGDDMTEIFCHGSPYIVSRLLSLSIANGAREAAPGEFTLRAFMNGKLDLAQAEAVNDLIISESETAHRSAITQVEGRVSGRIRKLKGRLIDLLGELEVRLDDAYGELPQLGAKAFAAKAAAAEAEIKDLADSFAHGRRLKHGLRVTIAGAPNSGKSSLLNRLAGRDRAIVSPEAGTTRDTIEERIDIAGFTVVLTDTAGIAPAAGDAVEREGMRRSLKALQTADLILWVRDLSRKDSPADRRVARAVERGAAPGADLIKAFNKCDLPPARTPAETADALRISCRTGQGIEALKRLLVGEEQKMFSAEASSIITSARHYGALLDAHRELERLRALDRPGKRLPLELAAEHLRGALNALAGILGETTSEEILGRIFEKFCVGK
ncbi:MAG: tRNA uridine-5-carboxymethylaminomethyl(34) synthesis GTPase MnmE [Elusimicrobiales bacterium]|jgi:tRNA modification GTPase